MRISEGYDLEGGVVFPMGIIVQEQTGLFHLQSSGMSYIIQIVDGFPVHVYWGDRLKHRESMTDLLLHTSATAGLDRLPQGTRSMGVGTSVTLRIK